MARHCLRNAAQTAQARRGKRGRGLVKQATQTKNNNENCVSCAKLFCLLRDGQQQQHQQHWVFTGPVVVAVAVVAVESPLQPTSLLPPLFLTKVVQWATCAWLAPAAVHLFGSQVSCCLSKGHSATLRPNTQQPFYLPHPRSRPCLDHSSRSLTCCLCANNH